MPDMVWSGPSWRKSESLRRSSCSADTTRRDSSARSDSRIRACARSDSTRAKRCAFVEAVAAKSASTDAWVSSAGLKGSDARSRMRTRSPRSSSAATIGTVRRAVGRSRFAEGVVAAPVGDGREAGRRVGLDDDVGDRAERDPARGGRPQAVAVGGRHEQDGGIGPEQPVGLVGGALQHERRVERRGHRAEAADEAVQERALLDQLAPQAPVPVLGGAATDGVAVHGPGRHAAERKHDDRARRHHGDRLGQHLRRRDVHDRRDGDRDHGQHTRLGETPERPRRGASR